jgi:hypothetical protein
MLPHVPHLWYWFAGAFALAMITGVIMSRMSRAFCYLRGIAVTRFSIMDLEFPGSPASIPDIVRGMNALPPEQRSRSRRALRGNLLLDFLFMAGIYPAIFLICIHCAKQMRDNGVGEAIFSTLAALQLVAWIIDILENFYLLRKLAKPGLSRKWVHKGYRLLVQGKWVIATIAGIGALSNLSYSWISGSFQNGFMYFGTVLLGLIAITLIVMIWRIYRAIFVPEPQEEAPASA